MIKTGRNDPCPCGSGKKYKKCCLLDVEETEFQYRRWRQIEAGLIPKLTTFAVENFGPEILEEAWKVFNDDEDVEDFGPSSPMNMVFMPWFLFTWIVEFKPTGSKRYSETTMAELFLKQNRKHVSPDEKTLLGSAIRCPYTLCEVTEVRPGVGMTQFDLLRRVKHEVIERSASETLKRGHIIYCSTTEVAGVKSNMGTSPYPLPPTAKRDVIELRKWIIDEIGGAQIAAEHLHEFEREIRGLYLGYLKGMLTPPRLSNTDGDSFVPQKLYFDLKSADRAFHSLKDLAEGVTESKLLQDALREDGLITRAEIPWYGGTEEARKRHGGSILLGLLKIAEDRLVVEVNSTSRAKRIRDLIEERLGDDAKYKTTLIEPIEPSLHEMWNAKVTGPSSLSLRTTFRNDDDSFATSDDEEPELREVMKQIAKQHWDTWFDLPVPALNDMTPREAAITEEGRELLESLLLLYESHQDSSPDNITDPDIPALRRELGMNPDLTRRHRIQNRERGS